MNRNRDNSNDRMPNSNTNREREMNKGTQDDRKMERETGAMHHRENQQPHSKKSEPTYEEIDEHVKGTVGSRKTGNNREDRAGIADIDKGLKR